MPKMFYIGYRHGRQRKYMVHRMQEGVIEYYGKDDQDEYDRGYRWAKIDTVIKDIVRRRKDERRTD